MTTTNNKHLRISQQKIEGRGMTQLATTNNTTPRYRRSINTTLHQKTYKRTYNNNNKTTMTSPSPSDPSGLVSNPPTTIVQIQGTARDDINGKLGIVVQYNVDRGRYLVHLTATQATVAMKPDNLQKAGYLGMAQAQYEQLTNDPNVRRMITEATARFLPPGVSLQKAGMGLAAVLVLLVFLLGFSRTLMLLSFGMMVVMMIGPDLVGAPGEGGRMATVFRNAPGRFQTMVRDQFPGGSYIADKPYAVTGLAALLVVFFLKSMMPPSAAAAASASMPFFNSDSGGGTVPHRSLLTRTTMEEYYKLGFDDASAQKDFGTSLPAEVPVSAAGAGAGGDPMMDDLPDYPMPPLPSNGGMFGKMLSISNAMSIMFLGRTVMELGKDADGSWQFALFRQNMTTLEPMKMGLLGLSVYRLVSAFLS